MLTQKQKSDWLENLKSGKYRRIGGKLKDGIGGHCCLDVLAITVGIKTSESSCVGKNGIGVHYRPFRDLLSDEITEKLVDLNDNSVGTAYSAVIPIIEKLPANG